MGSKQSHIVKLFVIVTSHFYKMPYKSKSKQKSIANARKVKAQTRFNSDSNFNTRNTFETDLDIDLAPDTVTAWTGGVNNHVVVTDNSDSDDTEWESGSSDEELEDDELEGDELVESLRREIEHEIQLLQELEPTPYEILKTVVSAKEWKKAKQNRGLGYNGRGKRTQRKQRQEAREKAEKDKIARKR